MSFDLEWLRELFQRPPMPHPTVRHEFSLARGAPRDDEDEPPNLPRTLNFRILRRLFSYTRPYAKQRNRLFVLVSIRSMQLPLLAWGVGAIIQGPVAHHDHSALLWAVGAYFALACFTDLTLYFRQYYALKLGEDVVRDLRLILLQHLFTLPMSFFTRTKLGRVISRMTSDIEAVRLGVQNFLFVALVQCGQMLCACVLMLLYSWKLFLVVLFTVPPAWLLDRYFRRRLSHATRMMQESFSRVTASLAETVAGIRVTQSFGREVTNAGIFKRLAHDHSLYTLNFARYSGLFIPLLEVNSQFFIATVLIAGGYGALHPQWHMPAGDLIVFFFLANQFFGPITVLGNQFAQMLTAMAGAERLFRMLDTPPDWQDAPDVRPLPPLQGRVEFHKVTFGYDAARPILHDLSFTAEPGQTIALVGHTGSGKTSIINLLAKFYVAQSGEILLDGHEIKSVAAPSLRRQMGLVLQHSFLFTGTVADNIRLPRPTATDAEVVDVLRRLDCLDLLESLPQGLATKVGEKGRGLSGGQQQLVCFARAMLADPRILILDEATSAIDTITEARLQAALARLLEGRTSFVVAHRLSTIRNASQVLVLDHGHLIERGTHNQLLAKGGVYARLYSQFAQAAEGGGTASA
ncbi:MAG TPA: ABC transporter ATP-binding protein [Opitutales bacterium]|nr:ABC transporter ATP-binding protein [Opitutales bacterium]